MNPLNKPNVHPPLSRSTPTETLPAASAETPLTRRTFLKLSALTAAALGTAGLHEIEGGIALAYADEGAAEAGNAPSSWTCSRAKASGFW